MEDIMARGKNKAKQTKVARELKYNSKNLDILALSQELHNDISPDNPSKSPNEEEVDSRNNYLSINSINK
jgi:hypothetical protein